MTALHNETLDRHELRSHDLLPPRDIPPHAAPHAVPRAATSCGRHCDTAPVAVPRGISAEDLQLFRLIATGLPIEAVARRLDLSERTVRRRTRAACDRLGVGTAIEAVVWAAHRGLL
jgi:DNA-binding NarL/FixJ family response regulator